MINFVTEHTEKGLIVRSKEHWVLISYELLTYITEKEAIEDAVRILESKAKEPPVPKWKRIKAEVLEAIEQGIIHVQRLDNYPNRAAILREAARLKEIDNPTFWIVSSLYLPRTPHTAHDFLVEQAERRTLFEDDFKFLDRDWNE